MKQKQALEVTPSPLTTEATAFIEQIRALRVAIPRLTPEGPRDSKALAPRAAVDEEFIEAAGAAMQASDLLDGSSPTTADALRDAMAFALAYQGALTEGKAFVRALAHTLRVAKATAGGHALNIYALAQRLVKDQNGAELVPHVENMRRKLKNGRRKAISEPAPGHPVKTRRTRSLAVEAKAGSPILPARFATRSA
jgi:hypothetical protein